MARRKRTRQELGYIFPVKIKLAEGRYTAGYVKSLAPGQTGPVRIFYEGSEKISTRQAEDLIHEPRGFNVLNNICTGQ